MFSNSGNGGTSTSNGGSNISGAASSGLLPNYRVNGLTTK